MLALGNSVVGKYVHVPPIHAPAPGAVVNGAFSCTLAASGTAATKRISPLNVTACPGTSPCASANTRVSAVHPAPAGLAPDNRAAPPRQPWNKGPYAGAA